MLSPSDKKKARQYWRAAIRESEAGNLENAIAEIEKAIAFFDGDDSVLAYFWASKGLIFYEFEKEKAAEDAAFESIRLDEKNHRAWIVLGLIRYYKHLFKAAAFCFKKAVETEEDYGTYTLLAAMERQFNTESAIEHAKRALELNPGFDEAQAILRNAEKDLKKK